MRERKFRAWDKKRKQFIEILLLHYKEDGIFAVTGSHDNKSDTMYFIEELDLSEYIARKDKNDKEICEGDICMWLGYEVKDGRQVRPKRLFIVEWDFHKLSRLCNIITGGTLEIIGNIYENPELLES